MLVSLQFYHDIEPETNQSCHCCVMQSPVTAGLEVRESPPDDEGSIMGGIIEREYEDEDEPTQPMEIDVPSQPFPVAVHRKQSKVLHLFKLPTGARAFQGIVDVFCRLFALD